MGKGREPNIKRSSLIRSLCACLCVGLLAGFCVSYAAGMQEQARTRPRAVPYAMEGQDEGPYTYLSGRLYLRKPLAAEGRAALLQILPGSDRWPLE